MCPGRHRADDQVEGVPVWCRGCAGRILQAIESLPGLAAGIFQMGHRTGQIARPGDLNGGRSATRIHASTASPAWDAIDELVSWAALVELRLRAHLGHARSPRWCGGSTDQAAAVLHRSVRYLSEWSTALLCCPFADELWEVVRLAAAAQRAGGLDVHVERLTQACSSCEKPRLVRVDGSDVVRCRACGRTSRQTDLPKVFDTTA